jgi:hypothetical protein
MYEGNIEDDLIIITKQTMDGFLEMKEPSECLSLYCFYYYTGKWQKTNQPRATNKYVKKGLKWGEDKIKRVLDQLIESGLIEKVIKRDEKGKIKGWYIKLNYMFKKDTITQVIHTQQMPDVATARCGYQDTNALSANSINALSSNNINALSVTPPLKKQDLIEIDGEIVSLDEYARGLTSYWKPICSDMKKLYSWKSQQDAIKELIKKTETRQLEYVLKNLEKLSAETYCASVMTPYKLNLNWDSVVAFIKKEYLKNTKKEEETQKELRFERAQLLLTRDRTPSEEERLQELTKLLK